MSREKIYHKDKLYTFLRNFVDWSIKTSYRKYEVNGLGNLPKDGIYIFAGNHCNTLMDALVILCANKDGKVFGARADVFNNPLVAKIMYFLRIVPMVRQRDGIRNVIKNNETNEIVVETLENKMPFTMFPEGRHRPAHSLLHVGKGIIRLSLAANARFGDRFPLYIVPVGIEYGDYFRYRSTALVNIGRPINVTEFVRNHEVDNELHHTEPLRAMLEKRMPTLFSYIKDDENLENKWTLTKMLSISKGISYGSSGRRLYDDMLSNREIIAGIEAAAEREPEAMAELLEKVKEFDRQRRKEGISIYSFLKKNGGISVAGKLLAAIVGLPYWMYSTIVSCPMWLTYKLLCKKVKDKAFCNTVGFGIKLAMGLLLFLIYVILASCLLPWPIALATLLLFIPSYGFFFDYIEGVRRLISDIKLSGKKKLRTAYQEIIKEFHKI